MAVEQRLYLDTSVISALHDRRAPERQAHAAVFWSRHADLALATSEVCRFEIMLTRDDGRREAMLQSLTEVRVFPLTHEMNELADRYMAARVFALSMENDALHVAAAVVARFDVLVSWNFRHLVNRRRRAAINSVNAMWRLPTIEIISPPEL